MRSKFAFAVGLLVSALFLWLAIRNADLDAIVSSLAAADPWLGLPFLAALFLFYWLKTTRWKSLLSTTGEIAAHDLFPIVMIGYAGTAILPMQMGELVRAWIASRRYGLRYSLVLTSIGVERLFDLLTILALFGIVLIVGDETPKVMVNAGYVIAVVTLLGFTFAVILALHTARVLEHVRQLMAPLPAKPSRFILDQLGAAAGGLGSITRPTLIARISANSLMQWGMMGVCIWCSLRALGIDVPAQAVALVLVATIIGISLPTSPGYVGNIQLAFVVALQPFGIEAEQAVAASIFYHVLAYVAVLVVGFGFLQRMGLGFRDLQLQAQPPDAASDPDRM